MEYRSVADLNQTILRNLHKFPRDIDLIVGVPRSGLLAANLLALHLNLPLTDVDGLLEGRPAVGGQRLKARGLSVDRLYAPTTRVLVVDDSVLTGTQMTEVRSRINQAQLPYQIAFCAIYASPICAEGVIDFYCELLSKDRIFEWNIMHHSILQRSCVDIDGVLCEDPTDEQNDDGQKYLEFVSNARPLYIPTVPVGWLVTCRLEKYRHLTEVWLRKQGVMYDKLIMMDLPSKAARVLSGSHARYKARVYTESRNRLFIESSSRQASEIAARTGKPVFCLETCRMETGIGATALTRTNHRARRWWSRGVRRLKRSTPLRMLARP